MPVQPGDNSHLNFLEPVVHYVKAIFAATNPATQAIAVDNAHSYFSTCLRDNRAAAHQLRAERLRLHQECQVPVHYSRHCRLICARHLHQHRCHQVVIQEINSALQALSVEEQLMIRWEAAFSHAGRNWTQGQTLPQQQLEGPAAPTNHPQVVFMPSPPVVTAPVMPNNAQH